jgi:hypothetical protein
VPITNYNRSVIYNLRFKRVSRIIVNETQEKPFESMHFHTCREDDFVKKKCKVKVKLSMCLTKHHAMKAYWGVVE